MYAIETDGLTKRFGDVTAVADVSMRVREGEVYGFLGPNGAGKSTTIAMLLDFVRPTAGSARLLGLDAREDHVELCRRVGVLPERCSLYDRLSGRRHLRFAIEATGAADDPDALLDRVGLDGAGTRPAGTYSTGMAQRCRLALALVGDPDLLILDEPSNGLDPNGVARLHRIVAEERGRGTTVFLSSHALERIEAVCDRIGILVGGRLVASGEPDELHAEGGVALSLSIDVERVPSPLPSVLESIDGVVDVTVAGGRSRSDHERIDVSFVDERAKAAVLRRIEDHARVVDFSTERRSLETLFARYAGRDR